MKYIDPIAHVIRCMDDQSLDRMRAGDRATGAAYENMADALREAFYDHNGLPLLLVPAVGRELAAEPPEAEQSNLRGVLPGSRPGVQADAQGEGEAAEGPGESARDARPGPGEDRAKDTHAPVGGGQAGAIARLVASLDEQADVARREWNATNDPVEEAVAQAKRDVYERLASIIRETLT